MPFTRQFNTDYGTGTTQLSVLVSMMTLEAYGAVCRRHLQLATPFHKCRIYNLCSLSYVLSRFVKFSTHLMQVRFNVTHIKMQYFDNSFVETFAKEFRIFS